MFKVKSKYKNILSIIIILITTLSSSISSAVLQGFYISDYLNLQYILIYFFCFYRFKYFKVLFLFFLGIVSDSLMGNLIGISSLAYLIIYRIAVYQSLIQVRSTFFPEWFAFGLAIIVVYFVDFILFYLTNIPFNFYSFASNFLGSFLLYPIFWFLLRYIYSRLDNLGNEK